jgi:hypothetical protein
VKALELEIVPAGIDLPAESKTSLEASFSGFFADAQKLKDQADTITEPAEARKTRLEVKTLRVSAEKQRKLLKEDSLRMGKAIDGANNILLSLIVPIEKGLEDIEKESERKEAARVDAIRQGRLAELADLNHDPHGIDVGMMDDEVWRGYLHDATALKSLKEAREKHEREEAEAEAKAEAERIEAQRLENIRLKAEYEAAVKEKAKAEAAAEKEKAKLIQEQRKVAQAAADAKAMAYAIAAKERAKIQAEADAAYEKAEAAEKAAAEAIAKTEKIKAEEVERIANEKRAAQAAEMAAAAEKKKASSAPDKARFIGFADEVRSMKPPAAKTPEGKKVETDISAKIKSFAAWIEKQTNTL